MSNQSELFQYLTVDVNGDIILPKDKEFTLIGRNVNSLIKIVLTYEPNVINELGNLRKPDISTKISNGSDTNNNVPNTNVYYFDSKYRNYFIQGFSKFEEDVIEVANHKYKIGLKANGSFILHPDGRYDYWGEVPFNRYVREKFNLHPNFDSTSDFTGHSYGAISLLPDAEHEKKQIKRLLRLLFHYHQKLYRTCLNCGYNLSLCDDIKPSWKPNYFLRKS